MSHCVIGIYTCLKCFAYSPVQMTKCLSKAENFKERIIVTSEAPNVSKTLTFSKRQRGLSAGKQTLKVRPLHTLTLTHTQTTKATVSPCNGVSPNSLEPSHLFPVLGKGKFLNPFGVSH